MWSNVAAACNSCIMHGTKIGGLIDYVPLFKICCHAPGSSKAGKLSSVHCVSSTAAHLASMHYKTHQHLLL